MSDTITIPDRMIAPAEWRDLRLRYAIYAITYEQNGHQLLLSQADLFALPLGFLQVEEEAESTSYRYIADASGRLIDDMNELVVSVITHKTGSKLRVDHVKAGRIPDGHITSTWVDGTGGSDDVLFVWQPGPAPEQ